MTATLEHPGIVAVYDAGEDADGTPWYTMRLIRGRTLRAVIDATPT
ncbi:MAG: serine/threonine-protein kinase, partial [Myxococcota bacterium]